VRFLQNPDLADESISANLASIYTSDHNNITNKTDIRQKKLELSAAGASQGMLHVSPAMQAPCLSRQLPIGWFISQVMRYYSLCRCLETSAAGASQGTLTVSSAMQAPCLSRHILRVTILRPLIPLCPVRLNFSLSHLQPTDQLLRQSHSQHHCKPLSHYAMPPMKVTVLSRRQRRAELGFQLIYHH
jgi:hypothetical protein